MVEELLKRIANRDFVIGVIGLGYVGLPLAREFLYQGFNVLGFDIDPYKVDRINSCQSYIRHIESTFLEEYVGKKKKFSATNDFSRLTEADAILICVPTPLGAHAEPDISFIIASIKQIASHLKPGHVVILESSTYPGTTSEDVLPLLQTPQCQVGHDFFLGFSPEREDPGNRQYSTAQIPKIVSGVTPNCLRVIDAIYSQAFKTVPVSTTQVAEAAKILENTYRAVNIAMINEMKVLFDRMHIDIWEVIQAAATKPFGFQPFYPGPGIGGHCIPVDPFYLTWKAREYDMHTRFIELAGEINSQQPYYVVERLDEALSRRGLPLTKARILLLGVAYKKDIDDMRESPALKILDILKERGAEVDYHDPHIPCITGLRRYPELRMTSVPCTATTIPEYHALLLVTDHSIFDYTEILAHARLVIDTRRVFPPDHERVVSA